MLYTYIHTITSLLNWYYVCMYYVEIWVFSQIRHCNIAPLYQLGFCHNIMYVCMYVYVCVPQILRRPSLTWRIWTLNQASATYLTDTQSSSGKGKPNPRRNGILRIGQCMYACFIYMCMYMYEYIMCICVQHTYICMLYVCIYYVYV